MATINAAPTKSFFIETLVKDIHLIDAILDLVDNSIDSYIKSKLRSRKRIVLNFSKDKFTIEDNCGGIKKEETYEHVFRFGLPTETRERTIGVYGIGLKRAFFKMGKDILIESDDGNDSFSVRIDKKWMAEENNWKLSFEKEEKTRGDIGTKITITDLHTNIADELASTTFQNDLIRRIKRVYSIFIRDKVTIEINGVKIDAYDFKFLCDGKTFEPFHKTYIFDGVDLEIFAGYTKVDTPEPVYGWNVFCNDRLVLLNDTSYKTGWGGIEGKNYHYPEDNRFLGLAFFRSKNPLLLPWHTTKEDIQYDSRVYRAAQVEMKTITNRLIEVIRLSGRTTDPETHETIGKAFFEEIPLKSMTEIDKVCDETVPAIKGEHIYESIARMPETTSIQYYRKTKIVKKVKEKLGNQFMTNRKVGESTFDYYVKMEEI